MESAEATIQVSVLIATFGDRAWSDLALSRAAPSAWDAYPYEVLLEHQPEGSVCRSRNAAARRATGDWLCFLDADDELDPAFVGSMGRAVERVAETDGNHDRCLFTPAVSHTSQSRRRAPIFLPEKPLSDNNWLVIGTLISRSLFWEVGGFDVRDPHGLEDWSLWTRAAAAGARVVKVPDAVYIAHQRRVSSHSRYARNPEYGAEYNRIRRNAWPGLYA